VVNVVKYAGETETERRRIVDILFRLLDRKAVWGLELAVRVPKVFLEKALVIVVTW